MTDRRANITVIMFFLATFSAAGLFYHSQDLGIFQADVSQEKNVQETLGDFSGRNRVEISVPAVDSRGSGVVGKFIVEAVPGSGRTLTNIDNLLYFVDTQFSIQTAKSVAGNITGIDVSGYDIIYGIESQGNISSVVEGPSAGAALTIATVAALEGKHPDPSVMITGSVSPDGKIGRIGGVASKIDAAEAAGANVLLVPDGQGLRSSATVERDCRVMGKIRFCATEYKPGPALATTESGLIVVEVSDISEALKYFIP